MKTQQKKALQKVQLSRVIPGILPPVDPPENAVATIDFVKILDEFDVASLNSDQIDIINRGNYYSTGYPSGQTYMHGGDILPIPPRPVEDRLTSIKKDVAVGHEGLIRYQNQWKSDGLITHYKMCRTLLSTAIQNLVCEYIITVQEKHMCPSEKAEEKRRWEQYERTSRSGYYQREKERYRWDELEEIMNYLAEHDDAREAVYKAVKNDNRALWAFLAK